MFVGGVDLLKYLSVDASLEYLVLLLFAHERNLEGTTHDIFECHNGMQEEDFQQPLFLVEEAYI